MKINDLQVIVRFKRRSNAERALSRAIDQGIWEAVQRIKSEYGEDLAKWPSHFMAILGDVEPAPAAAKEVVKVNFADLTDEDKSFIRTIHSSDRPQTEKERLMYERFGIASRTCDHWYKRLGLTTHPEEPDYIKTAKSRVLSDKKIHFYTAVQNGTPIFEAGFKSMLAYAEYHGAEVHCIPYRYKNPTSVFQDIAHEHWPVSVIPYLDDTRHYLADNLLVCSDIKIQPTHSTPLVGLQAVTNGATAIIPHPRLHLMSSAVLEGQHKQRLWTTGSLSLPNYTDTLLGKKSASHHCFGFLVAEIDGEGDDDNFHLRHVSVCDDGSFQDLWFCVDGDKITVDGKANTLRLGDIHTRKHIPAKIEASLALANILEPDFVVLDDVLDGESGFLCHHEKSDKVKAFHKIKQGRFSIQKEVEDVVELVKYIADNSAKSQIVVLRSNHDIWLDKLIRGSNWQEDPYNADFFAHCLSILLDKPDIIGLLPYFLTEALGDRVMCLGLDDSFSPDGSQHLHGHEGKNGSRGSIRQFSQYNDKVTSNHDHTPGRMDGAISAGASCLLRMGYNTGASSHGHGDVLSYPNHKRANIVYNKNFRFTTFKHPSYHV